jgi:ABC-type phosphate transport system substrate-binding protein
MTRKYLATTALAATLSFSVAHATQTTINTGGSSLAAPTYDQLMQLYAPIGGTGPVVFNYEPVGSGDGQKAFFYNDAPDYLELTPPATPTYGTVVGTTVDMGASDAFLTTAADPEITNPATGSYYATVTDSNGTFTGSSAVDGPMIQIPTIGTPITIAYNQSKDTKTLVLTDAQLCGVFSGKITDWHTLVSTIPANTTITVVPRADSSGTTFLTTQHLNAVCNASNSSFPTLPVPITTHFFGTSGTVVFLTSQLPSNFLQTASQSSGVASALLATSGSIGYLSPDYTSIAPKSPNATTLKVASLTNATNNASYQPTVANTTLGLANPGPTSTNPTPPASLTAAMNIFNWVPAIPTTTSGYPIVGYTTIELSSCYANKAVGTAFINLLTDAFTNSAYKTIINNNGFVPLANSGAATFATAVKNIFLTNTSKYNLNIDNTTLCGSYAGR